MASMQQLKGGAPSLARRPRFSGRPAPLQHHAPVRVPRALPASELADAVTSHQHHAQALLDLASAAAAAADSASTSGTAAAAASTSDSSWFAPLTNTLEAVLKQIQGVLVKAGVPYSYGYSIVLLTVLVKILTFPLTKKQVESAMAVQSLKPRIDMIKARYGEDSKRVQEETKTLYEKAEVNPYAGCLPSIATIPVFIGLYRSLTQVAQEGLLDAEGFYWIPNLAGPTSITTRGTEWLFPFVNGAPPIGWDLAGRYLALPVLLVVAQYISNKIITPPIDPDAEGANTQRALAVGLPLMVGYFALCVPSGLSLYYFSNTLFTGLMQVYLRKLGGATVKVKDLGPVTKVGSARRLGPAADDGALWEYTPPAAPDAATGGAGGDAAAAAAGAEGGGGAAAAPERGQVFFARRKKREAAAGAAAAAPAAASGAAAS